MKNLIKQRLRNRNGCQSISGNVSIRNLLCIAPELAISFPIEVRPDRNHCIPGSIRIRDDSSGGNLITIQCAWSAQLVIDLV